MLNGIVYFIVQTLILDPLQTEISNRLVRAGVPPQTVAEITECTKSSLPAAVRRATEDPQWAVVVALDVWLARKTPEQIVQEAAPSCKPAMDSARSYFGKGAV
ncbi:MULTISPECIES: hypothetical protein [Bradyrhizobium]|jgi:hypothetical protein|uniref:hypothetical protein n=1 Tax=Bradyrhizobium TaxID=374 RepID=UPI00041817EE|nr:MULTISPECIES: hypothetical protein [Bradyrhizobium]AUC93507.1 hypothetical protein CWS35_03600 [Bradyrhizobium sp. SK17]KIU46902.1 hypothetical protein QU41_21220 [Bradyrhizobium elkanii]MBK5655519.1 hypothetical protein [Rhizobium sp.]OCX29746.1 hypothetical protein QU42_18960 [Bradyrhizobium sp. UASWS1016]